jgi:hypothetical protein
MVSLTSNIVSPICKMIFQVFKIIHPTCKIILLVNLIVHQISKMMQQPCKTALRCLAAAFAAGKSFPRTCKTTAAACRMISPIWSRTLVVAHAASRVRHAPPQLRIIVPATDDAAPRMSKGATEIQCT